MSRFPIALLTSLIVLPLLGQGLAQSAPHDFLPVPPAALGPQIPEKGYLVQPIGDRLYAVLDGGYQSMFMVYDKGVVVVDAPASFGLLKLLAAVREVTDKPITHLVYSHPHTDHIGAAGLLPAGVTILAQQQTADVLRRARDPKRPVPTLTFHKAYTLRLGDQVLELRYQGANHDPGNIFIYAPKQKVLMLVDIVFPGWVTFKNLSLAEDIPGFLQAHDHGPGLRLHDVYRGSRQPRRHPGGRSGLQGVCAGRAVERETGLRGGGLRQGGGRRAAAERVRDLQGVSRRCGAGVHGRHAGDLQGHRLAGPDALLSTPAWVMVESLRTDY